MGFGVGGAVGRDTGGSKKGLAEHLKEPGAAGRGVHTCGDVTRPHLPEGAEGRGIWAAGAARICGPTNEPFSAAGR